MKGLVQRWGPTSISLLLAIVAIIIYIRVDVKGEFNEILQAAIVFASIIIGFTGVLMSILYSLSDRKAMEEFMSTAEYQLLKSYFKKCVFVGLLLVFISMALFIRHTYPNYFVIILFVWVFLLGYTFTGFYRIIQIIFSIAFTNDDLENKKPADIEMNEIDKIRLKETLNSQ